MCLCCHTSQSPCSFTALHVVDLCSYILRALRVSCVWDYACATCVHLKTMTLPSVHASSPPSHDLTGAPLATVPTDLPEWHVHCGG
jgi:hypothetical protein